ncbi:uncharacterized protein MONOS_17675 [Monocercomonoides exilis]|uniref:uncharacterized protein n=1 Tax=Monocercomonoides exilis TaxID=2049356 RepID=UPI00355A6FFD|nr:hypothetical protein MONOS_17675 [Monocercomonoides exilis]
MAYFDEADASVEYASLRIANRKQMSKNKMQESVGQFERWEAERAASGEQELLLIRTAGAAEGVSPTLLLLKLRGKFFKESELSRVTTVQKKMIVGEEYKVSVMLREEEKCEPCEGVLKMREIRRELNRKMGEKNTKRRAMEMSETMLARQRREEARREFYLE